MSCCSLGVGTFVAKDRCNAVKGWVDSCVITIKRQREQPTGGFAMKLDLPIRPVQSGPLTDREIEELNGFLLTDEGLDNAMDVSTFDGFICAVLSGPNVIMPSEWMRWV